MADSILAGETPEYSLYVNDENGVKEDPTPGVVYNDIIVFLYIDYNQELVVTYSTTGNSFERNGITYNPRTLAIVGNDMEFTLQSDDTEGKAGNLIIQIDTIGLDGTKTLKYTGVLANIIAAK